MSRYTDVNPQYLWQKETDTLDGIHGNDPEEIKDINDAIRIPSEPIPLGDGRLLAIKSWQPVVNCERAIEVTLTAIIRVPHKEDGRKFRTVKPPERTGES